MIVPDEQHCDMRYNFPNWINHHIQESTRLHVEAIFLQQIHTVDYIDTKNGRIFVLLNVYCVQYYYIAGIFYH